MTRFSKLYRNHLCLGCGLCASIGKDRGYSISLKENGFYSIDIPNEKNRDIHLESKMASCCPSITIQGAGTYNVWGNNLSTYNAYSLDSDIRFKASSGGFVTTACIYLLRSRAVDAILHVGLKDGSPIHNELKVSKTEEEVKNNCSSRYAPALMFENIKQILDSSNETYALIGKSCDILCIKNFESQFPQYKGRIKYTIAIFCAGMPSYKATESLIGTFNKSAKIDRIQYRGNGWPGSFTVMYADGTVDKTTYEDAWMNYLGKDIHFRCKICPDSIGTIADVSVGDSWIMEDGKVVFKDRPGISCVLTHTVAGSKIISDMVSQKLIYLDPLSESYLNKIQPNHIRKRLSSSYKIPVVRCMTPGIFKTSGLSLMRMLLKYNFLRGIKEAIGVKSRYNKWKNQ